MNRMNESDRPPIMMRAREVQVLGCTINAERARKNLAYKPPPIYGGLYAKFYFALS